MESNKKKIDWMITIVPFAIVVALGVIFFFYAGAVERNIR